MSAASASHARGAIDAAGTAAWAVLDAAGELTAVGPLASGPAVALHAPAKATQSAVPSAVEASLEKPLEREQRRHCRTRRVEHVVPESLLETHHDERKHRGDQEHRVGDQRDGDVQRGERLGAIGKTVGIREDRRDVRQQRRQQHRRRGDRQDDRSDRRNRAQETGRPRDGSEQRADDRYRVEQGEIEPLRGGGILDDGPGVKHERGGEQPERPCHARWQRRSAGGRDGRGPERAHGERVESRSGDVE